MVGARLCVPPFRPLARFPAMGGTCVCVSCFVSPTATGRGATTPCTLPGAAIIIL